MAWGSEPGIWQRFRRRRVLRSVVLYLGLAYLLVEIALSAAPHLELPSWGLRALFGAIVLGFPVMVVLAWTYDVTPTGIVKTPEETGEDPPGLPGRGFGWLLVGAGALALGVILRLLRG